MRVESSKFAAYTQKLPGKGKIKHVLCEDFLLYEYRKRGASEIQKIPYALFEPSMQKELKGVFESGYDTSIIAVVFCIVFLAFLYFAPQSDGGILNNRAIESVQAALMVLIPVLYLYKYLSKRDFTLFETHSGRVLILKDKNHDAILEGISRNRIKELRKLAVLDKFEALQLHSLEEAWKRFNWLYEEGVINADEFSRLRQEIDEKLGEYQSDKPELLDQIH